MRAVVAVVGRPNVGKSSLFNRIIGERLAITDKVSGITRDRIYSKATWANYEFSLIDTGGIVLKDEPFSCEIRAQAELAIDEANVIVFVVDARCGIVKEDLDVVKILNKSKKPYIIAANKVDDVTMLDAIYEFYRLKAKKVIGISALHGIGIGDLLDAVVAELPHDATSQEGGKDAIKFALIGQQNVGKSTLLNTLIGTSRVIVSDIPGTTRDAVDMRFVYNDTDFIAIDTAGIKKKGKIYENADYYSLLRAMGAIERCDIALFILDGTRPITELDKRIAGYIKEYYRGIVIVVNKWDAVTKDNKTMNEMTKKIKTQFQFLDYAPVIFISALYKQRTEKLLSLIKDVYLNMGKKIPNRSLNDVLNDAVLINQPPIFNGERISIAYATQTDVMPPTFVLLVNDEKHMHFSYLRYLENTVRSAFDFTGAPLKFNLKRKDT